MGQTKRGKGERTHLVIFQPSGRRGLVPEGTSLLEAGRMLGVGIESICGGQQTCGKCHVQIEEGHFERFNITSASDHLSPPSAQEQWLLKRRGFPPSSRLSCCATVQGEVLVLVPEESRSHKQIIRKSAGERAIAVDAPVRKYYVSLPPPSLADQRGDTERLLDGLKERFGLGDLSLDYTVQRTLQGTIRDGDWQVTAAVWMEEEIIRVEPGYQELATGLAVDIGTTTVAGYLCDLRTGAVLATVSMMNPQVIYGEDVMSRITYAKANGDGLDRMHQAIIEGLNQLAADVAAQAGIRAADILEVVLVGNTAMHHIVLNMHPEFIGVSPFTPACQGPVTLKARDLGLAVCPAAHLYLPPIEAGFVGADNVAVLMAEEPYQQDEMVLIIDVGTNGEILLGNRKRLFSASSPTGPVFEGAHIRHGMRATPGAIERVRIDPQNGTVRFKVIGQETWNTEMPAGQIQTRGICGSGVIEAVGELFRARIIEPNGRFSPSVRSDRLCQIDGQPAFVLARSEETATGQEIVITAEDIRALQLGKAALYSGVKILLNRLGIERPDRVILAGGFGSIIDKYRAMLIGLIPDCDPERVYAVGNAAGDGARILLVNRNRRQEAARRARWVEYVETTTEADFQDRFVEALAFPHMVDPFPHVEAWLNGAALP